MRKLEIYEFSGFDFANSVLLFRDRENRRNIKVNPYKIHPLELPIVIRDYFDGYAWCRLQVANNANLSMELWKVQDTWWLRFSDDMVKCQIIKR